jgi:hypothetical protein
MNTNIIYHIESLIEMQIMSLVTINFLISDDSSLEPHSQIHIILIGLLVIHILSHII